MANTDLKSYQQFRYPNPALWIMGLFNVFVLVKYMQWGARVDFFATIRLEFLLGVVLGIIGIGVLNQYPLPWRLSRYVLFGMGGLLITMIIQVPFAADQPMAQLIFQDRVVKFAFLTFFMAVFIRSPRYLHFFLVAFVLSCFWVTQETVQGLISGSLVWMNQGVMRLHGAVPIYRHANSLGGVAMGAVVFVVFLFPVWRNKLYRLGLIATGVTSMICVIYSGSRTAYVALIAFGFYWFLVSRKKKRWLLYALVVGAILLPQIPDEYIGRFKSIGADKENSGSRGTRVIILQDALTIFLENPAGVGVASFPYVRYEKFGRRQDTHNLYLEVATNLGVQGLLAFGLLIVSLSRTYLFAYRHFGRQQAALRRAVRGRDPDRRLVKMIVEHDRDLEYLLAVCRAAGGFLFVRMVLGFFGMDLYEIYWYFCAGLAIALATMTQNTARFTSYFVAEAEDSAHTRDQ